MSQINQVKDAINIIDIIGQYLDLKRSGTSYKGLCPFHGESSPSFFVSEQMQRYKCFGCQETGDVFTFLEKHEGLTFYEALEHLAEKAGITLEKTTRSSEDEERREILDVLTLTSAYYHFLLMEHKAGLAARTYLKDRGTANDSLKLFQIGYSLDSWDGLIKYLHGKKKYSISILEKAGLIIKGRNGRYYDRFRGRVMFPLKDHRGRVVGFSGRLLDSTAKEAKYINSPETLVYHKSQMLYGYSELLQFIRKENAIVLVEGEFDVISSAQAHINHVAAIKGSSLTADHVKLLQRTVGTIILSLDTDSAGVKATKRAIETIKQVSALNAGQTGSGAQLDLRVALLPEGKDPDDLAKVNPKAWREAIKQPISAYEFLIQAAAKEHGTETAEGKRNIMVEIAPLIAGITHAVERDFYIKRLAELLDVSATVIQTDVTRTSTGVLKKETVLRQKPQVKERTQSKLERLEEYLFFLLLNADAREAVAKAKQLLVTSLTQSQIKELVEQIGTMDGFSLDALQKELPEELQTKLFEYYTNEQYMSLKETLDIEEEWKVKLQELQKLAIQEKSRVIQDELRILDEKHESTPEDDEKRTRLLNELVALKTTMTMKR